MRSGWIMLGLAAMVAVPLGCDESRSRVDGSEADPVDRGSLDRGAMPSDAILMPSDAMLMPSDGSLDVMLMPLDAMVSSDVSSGMPSDAMPEDARRPDARPGPCRFEVEHVGVDALYDYAPIVDGETVYITERGPAGQPRSVRAADRAPVGGPSDILLAARDGAFLLARPDGDGGQRLIYRDGAGDIPIAERFDWPYGGFGVDWRPPQWVEPGDAIFILADTLYRLGDNVIHRLAADVVEAVLVDGQVGYVRRVADDVAPQYELWVADRRVLGPEPGYVPGTLGGTANAVWAAFGDRVCEAPWIPRRDAPCAAREGAPIAALHAAGAGAVVVGVDGGEARAHDGAGPALLASGVIVPRRVDDGGAVLAHWNDPDAWCSNLAQGAVQWHGVVERTVDVLGGAVTGCLCCGRYWPRFVLAASPTTVAWNYAGSEEAPAIAIARRRCD